MWANFEVEACSQSKIKKLEYIINYIKYISLIHLSFSTKIRLIPFIHTHHTHTHTHTHKYIYIYIYIYIYVCVCVCVWFLLITFHSNRFLTVLSQKCTLVSTHFLFAFLHIFYFQDLLYLVFILTSFIVYQYIFSSFPTVIFAPNIYT